LNFIAENTANARSLKIICVGDVGVSNGLNPNTINSPWVRKEIRKALEVEKQRSGDGYRVIPLLLPGIEPSAPALWFDEEPVGVKIELRIFPFVPSSLLQRTDSVD
jgi:hypothetical protein